ncbi:unnamed protein product [Timema podura]|uniref:NTR domain-containing protein n=1 Tax=Timema podura TaxID=61482 RepID=A0ABN7NMB1_TIMPD|nr:unnamed protein product [Timema podura]
MKTRYSIGFDNTIKAYTPSPDGSGEDGDISSTSDDTATDMDATQKAAILLKSGRLVTSGMSSMCGVDLKLEETYLIAGHVSAGQARISLCSFIQPWRETSVRQRKGFKLLYKQGCNCKIVNCPWWRDCKDKAQMSVIGEKNTSKNLCQWKTSVSSHQTLPDCQGMHSICMKLPGGGCGWTNDRQYHACMKTRRRMRDEQLAKEP